MKKNVSLSGFEYAKGETEMIIYETDREYSLDPRVVEIVPEVRYRGALLTPRQVEVLSLVGEGYSNIEIGEILDLSPRTVENHISSVRSVVHSAGKVNLGDRQMVLFARDMLDGYESFMRLQDELQEKKNQKLGQVELIEDWEDENEIAIKGKLKYEISEFQSEPKDMVYYSGVYHLI